MSRKVEGDIIPPQLARDFAASQRNGNPVESPVNETTRSILTLEYRMGLIFGFPEDDTTNENGDNH